MCMESGPAEHRDGGDLSLDGVARFLQRLGRCAVRQLFLLMGMGCALGWALKAPPRLRGWTSALEAALYLPLTPCS